VRTHAALVLQGHLSGMEIAGFESGQYFAFVVSDLNKRSCYSCAGLAPALNETLHRSASAAARRYNEMGETWLDSSLARDCSSSSLWGCWLRFRSRLGPTNDITLSLAVSPLSRGRLAARRGFDANFSDCKLGC